MAVKKSYNKSYKNKDEINTYEKINNDWQYLIPEIYRQLYLLTDGVAKQ